MNYMVFTDGACNDAKGKIAFGYVIRTNKKFICLGKGLKDGTSSLQAEISAIELAVDYITTADFLEKGDVICFRVDSQALVGIYSAINNSKYSKPRALKTCNTDIKRVWDKLKILTNNYTIQFRKIDSHDMFLNGNNLADRLAKYSLRVMSMEE